MSDEIVVLSNDVVPGMGLPVAAPGLRAWGIARGLRAHGHPVTLAMVRHVVDRAWGRRIPAPTPPSTVVARPDTVGDLVRRRRARAVVVTNSNHVESLGDLGDTALVYDFFAPKMLELAQADSADPDGDLERLRHQKLAALAASDAVIVNGRKKLPYVQDWLTRAGVADLPTAVVNMPLPAQVAQPRDDGPLHAVVSGYIQPWSLPGEWADAVVPFLEDGSMVLHLLVNNHWGGDRGADPLPETFRRLARMPGVRAHGTMEFGDFRRFLATCHMSIDLFAHNPERELAMVTRTAVALSCGLPVVHVPFTETSEFVRDHEAGWLVDSQDLGAISAVLRQAIEQPEELARRRAGAERDGREVLDPPVATAALHDLLGHS